MLKDEMTFCCHCHCYHCC